MPTFKVNGVPVLVRYNEIFISDPKLKLSRARTDAIVKYMCDEGLIARRDIVRVNVCDRRF
jgi:hypothetical protein